MATERDDAALFAHRLRALLDERDLSVRAFGRLVDPEDPERGRRRANRHLSGRVLPSRASRDNYAAVLGVPTSALPLPDDAERDGHDPLGFLARAKAELKSLERYLRTATADDTAAPLTSASSRRSGAAA